MSNDRIRRQLAALTEEIRRAESAGMTSLVDQLLRQKQRLVYQLRTEKREEAYANSN